MYTLPVALYPSERAEKELLILFNSCFGLDAVGTAFVWCGLLGNDGQRYGSYKRVKRCDLHTRFYIVEWSDYAPNILLLDTLFNPKVPAPYAYTRLSQSDRLRTRRWKLKRGCI